MVRFATQVPVTCHVRETASVYAAETSSAPQPEPLSDTDRIEALEEEIVFLAAHVHAAEHRFLTLVAEYDRLRGWEVGGHRSCAHWLAFRTGYSLGAARERVRAARALAIRRPGRTANPPPMRSFWASRFGGRTNSSFPWFSCSVKLGKGDRSSPAWARTTPHGSMIIECP